MSSLGQLMVDLLSAKLVVAYEIDIRQLGIIVLSH